MRKQFALLCAMCVSVLVASDRAVIAGDPSTLPLLQLADLSYAGGFRLPRNTHTGEGYSFGGLLVAHNPSRNSLFVSNRAGKLSEVTIPAAVNTADPNAMPFATYLQDFSDPTEGHMRQIASSGANIDGLLVVGNRLYGTGAIYYDAQNTQTVSHYSRSTNLSEPSFIGMSQVWETGKTGFVSGYLATVPPEWQSLLGGPAITGQCCIPVVWRTSWGPSAFAWNPADIGRVNPVSATPLLYYPSEHQTLGPWLGSNPTYGGNVQMGGLAIIAGTRTALYIGRNAMGVFCYGNGTSNPSEAGQLGPDGTAYCYDPTNPYKGPHGYPYRYQIWAYDLNEFVKVKAGLKQPWEVVPYGVWPLNFPTAEPGTHVGGVGYDASRQMLYVSQMFADHDGYEDRPVIHALKVNAATSAPPASSVPAPPPPSTAPSLRATAVTIVANKPAPQPAGTAVTFSAAPTGGVTPHQYKWWLYDGVAWSAVSGWETSQSFTWTPATANPLFRFGVWVRSSGNTADALEATTWVEFSTIGGSAAPPPATVPTAGAVSAVTISPNRAAPQPPGTMTTWTATATGGAPQQFKWWVYDGLTWAAATSWTTNATFAWTPSAANPNFRVGVWAKGAGNTTDVREASAEQPFAITSLAAPVPAPPTVAPAPPPSGTTVTSLVLSSNKVAPQPRGSTMVFTASPAGGVAPHQYKWFIYNGYGWLSPTGWTTSNTFSWSPGDTNPLYKIGLWVRSAGNAADAKEFSAEMAFPTVEPIVAAPIATASAPASKASSVALTPNQTGTGPGVTVTFTATPSGGVAPHQYKWFVYDGAWRAVTGWTTSSQFAWTPTVANPLYRIGVWVRSAGATADALEVSREYAYPVGGGS